MLPIILSINSMSKLSLITGPLHHCKRYGDNYATYMDFATVLSTTKHFQREMEVHFVGSFNFGIGWVIARFQLLERERWSREKLSIRRKGLSPGFPARLVMPCATLSAPGAVCFRVKGNLISTSSMGGWESLYH